MKAPRWEPLTSNAGDRGQRYKIGEQRGSWLDRGYKEGLEDSEVYDEAAVVAQQHSEVGFYVFLGVGSCSCGTSHCSRTTLPWWRWNTQCRQEGRKREDQEGPDRRVSAAEVKPGVGLGKGETSFIYWIRWTPNVTKLRHKNDERLAEWEWASKFERGNFNLERGARIRAVRSRNALRSH